MRRNRRRPVPPADRTRVRAGSNGRGTSARPPSVASSTTRPPARSTRSKNASSASSGPPRTASGIAGVCRRSAVGRQRRLIRRDCGDSASLLAQRACAARTIVCEHDPRQLGVVGRLARPAARGIGPAAQFVEVELPRRGRLPRRWNVQQKDRATAALFQQRRRVAHLIADGRQHQAAASCRLAARRIRSVAASDRDRCRGQRRGRRGPAAVRAQPQPMRPQTVGRDPLGRHKRTAVGDRVHGLRHTAAPAPCRCRPRTVSNRASTRMAMRGESDGE